MINPRFAGGIFRLLVFAPPCANACAVFRPCGLRFAPCPRGSSRFAASDFAPPCANACAVFRPCGLRFAPCPRGSSRFAASDFAPPCANACALFRRCAVTPPNPSVAATPRHLPLMTKGGFGGATSFGSATFQKAPFSQKGAVGVSRLRDYLRLLSAKLTEELLLRTSCASLVNPSVTAAARHLPIPPSRLTP